jgi:hypothetical protein
MKSIRSFLLAVFVLIVLSTGCSSVPASLAIAPAQETAVPLAAAEQASAPLQFPIGHFRSLSNPGGLVLAFHDRHHFQVFLDNALLDSGLLDVTGTHVAIDSLKCAAHGDKPAHYTWLYAESDLTFQALTPDPCAERRQYLAEEYEPLYLFVRFSPAPEMLGGAS